MRMFRWFRKAVGRGIDKNPAIEADKEQLESFTQKEEAEVSPYLASDVNDCFRKIVKHVIQTSDVVDTNASTCSRGDPVITSYIGGISLLASEVKVSVVETRDSEKEIRSIDLNLIVGDEPFRLMTYVGSANEETARLMAHVDPANSELEKYPFSYYINGKDGRHQENKDTIRLLAKNLEPNPNMGVSLPEYLEEFNERGCFDGLDSSEMGIVLSGIFKTAGVENPSISFEELGKQGVFEGIGVKPVVRALFQNVYREQGLETLAYAA